MDNTAVAVQRLHKVIGEEALEALRNREATLRIWRRSSPHNWWIQPTEDEAADHLWHSSEGMPMPDLGMFELIEHADKTIQGNPLIIGRDAGAPEESVYTLENTYCS